MAFEHDLGLGRHLERHGLAVDQLDPLAAQQAGELVFRQRVGHRRHRGDDRAGIGADHGRGRQRLALLPALQRRWCCAPPRCLSQRISVVSRPGHLHAVDAEVEAVLARRARALGDDQRPGDQRRRLARPAGLDRQPAEIDVGAAAARSPGTARAPTVRGRIAITVLQQRQHVERLAPAAGRLRLLAGRPASRRPRAAGAARGPCPRRPARPCRTG